MPLLTFDLDLEAFVQSPTVAATADDLYLKHRFKLTTLAIQFCRAGVVVDEFTEATGILTFKSPGQYEANPVLQGLNWVKSGSGTGARYTFTFSTDTAASRALLGIDGSSTSNDVPSVALMAELQVIDGDVEYQSQTLNAILFNEVGKPTDQTPGTVPVIAPSEGSVPLPSGIDTITTTGMGWATQPLDVNVWVSKPDASGDNILASVRIDSLSPDGFIADLYSTTPGTGYRLGYRAIFS